MESSQTSKSAREPPAGGRIWELRKKALTQEIRDMASRSPVLRLESLEDLGDEIRAAVGFNIKTLVRPLEGEVRTGGPVLVGIRYHRSYLRTPPPSAGIVTVLAPHDVYHPNLGVGRGLCLGSPPVGITMENILCQCFAALTLSSYNSIEWQGLDPSAARFVRANAHRFPLLDTGLFEDPPAHLQAMSPEYFAGGEK